MPDTSNDKPQDSPNSGTEAAKTSGTSAQVIRLRHQHVDITGNCIFLDGNKI